MSETHVAYWELAATADHVLPVARGGAASLESQVSCSMLTNSIKANWTLDELGWTLKPCGAFDQWDGLLRWFVHRISAAYDAGAPLSGYYRRWYEASKQYAV